jgi:hypothetical protein
MSNFLYVENAETPWLVRMVFPGETYGQWIRKEHNFALTYSPDDRGERLIEFYDLRDSEFQPYSGQRVSCYCAETLLETADGLLLNTGDPRWSLTNDTMRKVREWIRARKDEDREHFSDTPERCEPVLVVAEEGFSNGPAAKAFFVIESDSEWAFGEHINSARELAEVSGMSGEMVTFCEEELHSLMAALRDLKSDL